MPVIDPATPPKATPPDATPPNQRPPTHRGWLRALALRLHFYVGIFVGPFLLVAALSGAVYALSPQLEPWLYAEQLDARTEGPAIPLATQVESAQEVVPDSTLTAVRPAPAPGDTTRVLFDDGTQGVSESQTVFIDPATGDSQGVLATYGTSGALPIRTTIDQLHRNLLLGDAGRVYSELAASWLWVLALAGAALWLSRPSRRGRWRSLLIPDRSRRGRAWTRSLHGSLGLWLLLGFLGLSATGLTWSTYAGEHVAQARAQFGWLTPGVDATLAGDHETHQQQHHGGTAPTSTPEEITRVDGVLNAARASGIDAGKLEIVPPTGAGQAWTVSEIDRSWPTQVDVAAVDGTTGRVVDSVRFADYPLMAKFSRWGIDAHMGTLFGLPNQLALTALGLGLAVMVALGYRMWWQRRPTAGGSFQFGRAYPRGALRRAPKPAVVAIGLLTVLVGWFLPLVGISLAAFIVLDVVLGTVKRLRA